MVLAATVALEGVSIVLSWGLEPRYDTILYAVYAATLAGAGAAIVARHPRHAIGWLFLGGALWNALVADAAQGYGLRAAHHAWPLGPYGEWLGQISWLPSGLGWTLTFLLFPSGVLGGRARQRVAALAVAGTAVAVPGWGLSPSLRSEFVAGRNPMAVDAAPTSFLLAAGITMFLAAFVAAVALLVVRFVRARGAERQQLKWLVTAAGCAGVVLPASALLWSTVPAMRPLAAVALTALPVAACIGILRYRLYDIDVVLNRTLVYATVTAILGGAYAASVLLAGILIGRHSPWAIAIGTLTVAVAFGPVRRRVQDNVDRRFNRARYEAVQRVTRFVDDVRAGRAAPEDIEAVLRSALAVDNLELRFFLPDANGPVNVRGQPVTGHADADAIRCPITQDGRTVGVVAAGARDEAGALLPVLVHAGALAIEIARLRLELQRQLEEVEASRARLATAADEERRRLERDLHDGAQQRLVSIGLALRHAQHALRCEAPGDATRTLDGAVAEVAVAIDELRELARGIRPAHLEAGLGPALRELARRAPVRVEIAAANDRFAPDIEAAAYFTAAEGLTNAVKHAHAGSIAVRADRVGDNLVVSVTDDGAGGAEPRDGSGLRGLSDRVTAHGGTLSIVSPPGRGTTLTAEFPCGS